MSTSVEEAIVAHLRNDTAVAALVGTRIYETGLLAQASELPAVTFQLVSAAEENVRHDGPSGLDRSVWQFTCYATRGSDSISVAVAVRNALIGFNGGLAGRVLATRRRDLGRDPESKLYAQLIETDLVYSYAD